MLFRIDPNPPLVPLCSVIDDLRPSLLLLLDMIMLLRLRGPPENANAFLDS